MTNTNTLLAFGDSGSYKTTNFCFAAKYMYEKTGKPVRWVTAEPVIPYQQALVDAGVIQLCRLSAAAENPLVVLRKLSTGLWPERDTAKGWIMKPLDPDYKKHLHLVGERFSAYFVETLDSIGEVFMEDIRSKARKISEEPVGLYTEEDEKFSANPKSHYGFVQREVVARLVSFSGLPVERVFFSAHERRGEEDDEAKSPIRGPAVVGKAATDKIGKDVGTLLHCDILSSSRTEKVDGKDVQKLEAKARWFFMNHPDARIPTVIYKCKPRFPPDQIPKLMAKWPGGYFEPGLEYGGTGLDSYIRFEDELLASQASSEKEWKAKIDAARRTPQAEAKTN